MANEPEQIAAQRRALGAHLADFRIAAGLTQGQLAKAAFCDRTTVVHIEKGRRSADKRFWQAVDAACSAGGTLLAGFVELISAKHAVEQHRHAAAVAHARTRALAAPEPAPAQPTAHLPNDQLVGHIVDMAADESSRFLAWAEDENVGELTIEQLHAQIRRISHAYLKVPIGPLFIRTRELRDRAFELLSGQQRPSHARDLYAAAGWSLTVLAWMSVDLGRPDAAEDHARAAWLCAERADHHGLRAWVRATQHTAASWQNDFTRAAGYAADGLRYATGSASLFLASAHALDLARSGQHEQATAALHQAQQFTGAVDGDELAGPFTCTVDRAIGFWAAAQLSLGAPAMALDHASRSVAAFEDTAPDSRNQGSERMARMQLVRAHLALGQLAEAEQALNPVLETAPEHRVRPLLVLMHDVFTAANAEAHRATPVASRIRNQVRAFHQAATARELAQ